MIYQMIFKKSNNLLGIYRFGHIFLKSNLSLADFYNHVYKQLFKIFVNEI